MTRQRRWLLLASLLALGVGCTLLWHWQDAEDEWTTSSSSARDHFESGFDAWGKAYYIDAIVQFEAAVELDPDFAMPMLFLSSFYPPGREERRLWLDRLEAVDRSRLSEREAYLVRYGLAWAGRIDEDPRQVLAEFLQARPDDPFAIRSRCDVLWSDQLWDAAEACYQSFLQLYPNWAMAQNRLGYIAMAQGRFSEAEERFLTYRYIAPDQANPYLSMGELLMLLGRYEEAELALAQAVRIKPDLCPARALRSELKMHEGDFAAAERLLQEMKEIPSCGLYQEIGLFCSVEAWLHYFAGDLEGAHRSMDAACLERRKGFDLLAHRLAVMGGDMESARAMELALHEHFEEVRQAEQPVYETFYTALEAHMQGVRALAAEDFAGAAEDFQRADAMLDYWGGDRSGFKPFNRLNWLRALERAGDRSKATAVRHKIDAVNPRLVQSLHLADLEVTPGGAVH